MCGNVWSVLARVEGGDGGTGGQRRAVSDDARGTVRQKPEPQSSRRGREERRENHESLRADKSCCQPGEPYQSIQREQWAGEMDRVPFAGAGREDKALQKSAAIGRPFPQAHHEAKVRYGFNVV